MATFDLTGSGVHAVTAGTSRLFVEVLAFPAGVQTGQANPTNYFHVGLLRLGVGDWYGTTIPIDASQMFIDLPAGVTELGFRLFAPASIRVTEVAGGGSDSVNFDLLARGRANSSGTITLATVPAGVKWVLREILVGVQAPDTGQHVRVGVVGPSPLGRLDLIPQTTVNLPSTLLWTGYVVLLEGDTVVLINDNVPMDWWLSGQAAQA